MPARGRIPALGEVAALAEGVVVELDPLPIAAHFGDEERVSLHVITSRSFGDGVDAIPVAPVRAWRIAGEVAEPTSIDPALRFAFVLPNACAPRLVDRCRAEVAELDARCAPFEESVDVAENSVRTGFLLPLDDTRVLFSNQAFFRTESTRIPGQLFVADFDTLRVSRVEAVNEIPSLAAYQRRPGAEIFVWGPEAAAARDGARLEFTAFTKEIRPPASQRAYLAGPQESAGDPEVLELFALDSSGLIEHFDGERWRQLIGPDGSRSLDGKTGGIVWLAPGEALAAGSYTGALIRIKDRELSLETVGSPNDRPSAIARIPNFGIVIGTDAGALYRFDNNSWTMLESPLDGRSIIAIAPFRRGFVFAHETDEGSAGELIEWTPEIGLCPAAPVTARGIRLLAPFKDGFAVASQDPLTASFVGRVQVRSYPSCDDPAAPRD